MLKAAKRQAVHYRPKPVSRHADRALSRLFSRLFSRTEITTQTDAIVYNSAPFNTLPTSSSKLISNNNYEQ